MPSWSIGTSTRPNPVRARDEPAHFAAFMREHGVRFVVVARHSPYPALDAVVAGSAPLEGYARLADLPEDVVFERW